MNPFTDDSAGYERIGEVDSEPHSPLRHEASFERRFSRAFQHGQLNHHDGYDPLTWTRRCVYIVFKADIQQLVLPNLNFEKTASIFPAVPKSALLVPDLSAVPTRVVTGGVVVMAVIVLLVKMAESS